MKYKACYFPLTLSLMLSTCSKSPTGVENSTDRIVAGVNFTQLFVPPTSEEINAIQNEWANRDVSAQNYQLIESLQVFLGPTPATLRVVSHTVDGFRHYGAILSPNGALPNSLPVIIYTHGGDNGLSLRQLDLQLISAFIDTLADNFIFVVPSFRSEPLRTETNSYLSEGDPSPWDRDVDDALALLDVALENTPEADPSRIGIMGFSRGATVGMLMAIRDPRIDLVIEYFGPTDFFGEFAQTVFEEALSGHLRDLPGLDYLNVSLIQPLKNGQLTIQDARQEILRRSPVYFAAALPQLQVHHGTADAIVPVTEAERLIAVMQQLGRNVPDFESYIYQNGSHDPLTLPGSLKRSADFLSRLVQLPFAELYVKTSEL